MKFWRIPMTALLCFGMASGLWLASCGDDDEMGTPPPEAANEYGGTYIFPSDTDPRVCDVYLGQLRLEITSASGLCSSKVDGVQKFCVTQITETDLGLRFVAAEGIDDEVIYTRDAGTAGDIVGSWSRELEDGIKVYEFNEDLSFLVTDPTCKEAGGCGMVPGKGVGGVGAFFLYLLPVAFIVGLRQLRYRNRNTF